MFIPRAWETRIKENSCNYERASYCQFGSSSLAKGIWRFWVWGFWCRGLNPEPQVYTVIPNPKALKPLKP